MLAMLWRPKGGSMGVVSTRGSVKGSDQKECMQAVKMGCHFQMCNWCCLRGTHLVSASHLPLRLSKRAYTTTLPSLFCLATSRRDLLILTATACWPCAHNSLACSTLHAKPASPPPASRQARCCKQVFLPDNKQEQHCACAVFQRLRKTYDHHQ